MTPPPNPLPMPSPGPPPPGVLPRLEAAVSRSLRRLLLALLLAALFGGVGSPAAARGPMTEPSRTQPAETNPARTDDLSAGVAVELLRLGVPAESREAWLAAEAASWGPWLRQQEGYLGRQLFWDPQRQEGTLLIRWASREQWKAIPMSAVGEVQERFERLARELSGSDAANPFPLLHEAELLPQPQLELPSPQRWQQQPPLQPGTPDDG